MAIVPRVTSMIAMAAFLAMLAVAGSVTNDALGATKYQNQPHITFNSPDYNLEKITEDVKEDSKGWSETAFWKNAAGDELVSARIFAHVSYSRVILRSHVQSAAKRVRDITGGDGILEGNDNRVDTENGFYEYQAYSLNGVQCVYIQSYWGDRSFGGVDMVRGADPADKIVGNHMLQAVVCDQRKKEIGSKDVAKILASIDLRDAHWSRNWIVLDPVSAAPPATSSEPTFDSQANSGSRPVTKLEGISGSYRSEITTNANNYYFKHKKHRKMIIVLEQNGKKIIGTNEATDTKITGVLEGDTIKFRFYSSQVNPGSDIRGEWKISKDRNKLEGSWAGANNSGSWNLTRIE